MQFISLQNQYLLFTITFRAFYADPKICNDMIYSFNNSIHVLVSVSIGYFIYDFFDMFIYHKKRSVSKTTGIL